MNRRRPPGKGRNEDRSAFPRPIDRIPDKGGENPPLQSRALYNNRRNVSCGYTAFGQRYLATVTRKP